mmetsp:Transcript_1973/g.5808  ORF Transcript_1973/g.5808 Transcript_1973/m.5808 type:complete len:86 (+) Transcript_1973:1276-1533(+)
MNVEGLTRENVASHLQKYRLHLKRNTAAEGEGTHGESDFGDDQQDGNAGSAADNGKRKEGEGSGGDGAECLEQESEEQGNRDRSK